MKQERNGDTVSGDVPYIPIEYRQISTIRRRQEVIKTLFDKSLVFLGGLILGLLLSKLWKYKEGQPPRDGLGFIQ